LGERSDAVFRAARNLERVHVVTPNGLCLLDILKLPRLIVVESAVAELTRTLTADLSPRKAEVELARSTPSAPSFGRSSPKRAPCSAIRANTCSKSHPKPTRSR